MSDMAQPQGEEEVKKKRGKKALLIPLLVLVLGISGGGFFFLTGGDKGKKEEGHETTTTTIVLGKMVRLDPLTLNLSDGHVLKVGLALQFVEHPHDKEMATILGAAASHGSSSSGATSPLEGLEAKALDKAIAILGDSTFTALSKPGGRQHAKEELTHEIKEVYEGDVVEVYFTDFVMS